jgi:hypothetical protein
VLPLALSALAAMASLSRPIAFACGASLALSGCRYRYRIGLRRRDGRYTSDRRLRLKLRAADRLSLRWIGSGLVLATVALFVPVPLVAILLGVFLSLFTFLNGVAVEGDIAAREGELRIRHEQRRSGRIWADRFSRIPLVRGVARLFPRRRGSLGDVGIGLATMLVAVLCSATIFVGLAVGEAVQAGWGKSEGERHAHPGQRPPEAGVKSAPEGTDEERTGVRVTYAELCVELPDPLAIHHGLGPLFRRAGALIAGCGRREQSVSGLEAVWFAEGTCSGETRSLAVSSPGYNPTLLLGEAAPFARDAALRGELLFADAAEPGNGVVYAVGTTAGTYFFVASSPVFATVPEDARRCSEVTPTNPLIELSPSLARRWLCQVEHSGWVWPVESAGEALAFLDESGEKLVQSAGCSADGVCGVETEGCNPEGEVTLAALTQYMPADP